jgi:hypothetical protein
MRGITATGLQEYRGLPIHRSNNTFWATAFVVRGDRDVENTVEVLEREKALETRRCSGNGMVLVTWAARYRNKSCVLACIDPRAAPLTCPWIRMRAFLYLVVLICCPHSGRKEQIYGLPCHSGGLVECNDDGGETGGGDYIARILMAADAESVLVAVFRMYVCCCMHAD